VEGSFANSSVAGSLKCSFGHVYLEATYISPTAIECTAPPLGAGIVYVEATVDGFYYSNNDVPFAVLGAPSAEYYAWSCCWIPGSSPSMTVTSLVNSSYWVLLDFMSLTEVSDPTAKLFLSIFPGM